MSDSKLYAVVGDPVLHSKSPLLFNSIFCESSHDSAYTRIAASSAEEAVYLFKELGLSGMNVTSPFKEKIMPLLDKIDDEACSIGSVNTVLRKDDKLYGYNTDHIGVTEALKENDVTITGRKCVVLGAGGAARAAAYAVKKAGGDVAIVNRTFEKAERLAAALNTNCAKFEDLQTLLKDADLLIYTIPSALASFHGVIKEEWLSDNLILLDANYKNRALVNSRFKVIDGKEWLINQAMAAYQIFTGKEADKNIMKKSILEPLYSQKNNITIMGGMGSGKTSVGKLLALKTNFNFVDTDSKIESETKEKISDIFKTKGEEHFRALEKEAIKVIEKSTNSIFSIGGGAVIDSANRALLKDNSIVVWLYSSPEESVSRIKENSDIEDRPLLNCDDPVKRARNILANRLKFYAETADIVVNTNGKTIEKTVGKIYGEINKAIKYFWGK